MLSIELVLAAVDCVAVAGSVVDDVVVVVVVVVVVAPPATILRTESINRETSVREAAI